MSLWLYTALLALVAVQRLFELWLSRRNARWALERGGEEHGKGHFRVMTLLHTLFLICCVAEPWVLGRTFPGSWGFVALGGLLAAQALRYWAIFTLGPRWNVRIVVFPGGEPVTRGPYRFIRHPNYVAVAAEILLLPLIHGAWLTSLVFSFANALLLVVRIRAEERALGASYADHFSRTPRFVPLGR